MILKKTYVQSTNRDEKNYEDEENLTLNQDGNFILKINCSYLNS